MPVETRSQLAARYRAVVEAAPISAESAGLESEELVVEEREEVGLQADQWGWWEEAEGSEMASGGGAEGRQRFSAKKGDGLTIKQFELMTKGSLLDRFKKAAKRRGESGGGSGEVQWKVLHLLGGVP